MTKRIFSIFVLLIAVIGMQAANVSNSKDLVSPSIELTLEMGDITELTSAEIGYAIDEFIDSSLEDFDEIVELQCTVRVTGSIGIGPNKIQVEVEVTGPCSEIIQKGKEIAQQILDDIKGRF